MAYDMEAETTPKLMAIHSSIGLNLVHTYYTKKVKDNLHSLQ